ncbi:hypothetical protein ACHAXS_006888 [Conticribra weissflogii]
MKFTVSAVALISAVASTASAQSIYEIASGNDSFSTLTAAVDAANLTGLLSSAGTYTVFAPTDDAFAALPDGTVDKLLQPEWIHHLTDVLSYHVLGSVVLSTDLTDGMTATTANGEDITINLDPVVITTVSNTTANVLTDLVDISADNGVIHAVDAVLLPTSATSNIVDLGVANSDFSTLVAAVTAAGLVDALSGEGPFTLFAPTNDAFAALPDGTLDSLLLPENVDALTNILTYHVVEGIIHSSAITADVNVTALNGDDVMVTTADGVKVNGANVIEADVLANNGIIHVIDAVILPPEADVDGVLIPTSAGFTIVDIAGEVPQFSTLAAAITAADLNGVLSGEGPFTVFAPTDDAFAALPNGTLDSLLLPENKDALAKILSYHVLQGNVRSSTIIDDVNVTTLSGHDLHVHVSASASLEEGTVQLNNGAASVFFPDFLASNGIIHVIDAVLIPPEDDNVTTTTGTTEMPMTTATTTAAAAAASDGDDGETETDAMEMAATTTVAPGEPSGETEGDGGEEVVEDSSSATTHYFVAAFGVLVASSWSMLVL